MMCSLQRLALSILLLGASLQLSTSWPTRLTATTVCQNLHVTHRGSEQNSGMGSGNVSLVLLKNGKEVSCYEPEQEYDVELRSNYKKMMGVLWMLDPVTGEFPLGSAPRNTKKNSVCENPHISHYCEDQSSADGCILGENGMALKVGYRAPSLNNLHTLVVFRYTVVFKKYEYVKNAKQHFERCVPTTDSDITTPTPEPANTTDSESPCTPEDNDSQVKPEDSNLTSLNGGDEISLTNKPGSSQQQCNTFEPKEDATAVSGHCGIERVKSNESRPYTDPDTHIDYICTILEVKRYVRRVTCESRCEKDGQKAICRVKNSVERKRNFICHPTSDFAGFGNVYREFTVEQQSQCECYHVSDIDLTCPTTPPPVRCPTTTQEASTPSPATTTTQSNRLW